MRRSLAPQRVKLYQYRRVDQHLRYADIKDHPETYRGKLMLAGGKVLSAKRTQDRIRIEVLQIPLSEDLIPTGRDSDSKGRFVIIQQVPEPAVKHITVWDWDHMKGGYGRYYGYGDPFPWAYRGYYGESYSW